MAAVPPAPTADSWVDSPNAGNFNPARKSGQAIFEKKTHRLTATKKDAQAICRFLGKKAPELGKVVTQISITYDDFGYPNEWGNLLCEYSSISMNLLQRESHNRFRNPVATVDTLPTDLFTVTILDPSNYDANKKLFYSRVDSQVVAELSKIILTDAEYSKLMLKKNMFTFQDDTTGNERIDGPCLLKLLFDRIDPNVVVGVKVLRQKLDVTKLHPYQNDVDAMLTYME